MALTILVSCDNETESNIYQIAKDETKDQLILKNFTLSWNIPYGWEKLSDYGSSNIASFYVHNHHNISDIYKIAKVEINLFTGDAASIEQYIINFAQRAALHNITEQYLKKHRNNITSNQLEISYIKLLKPDYPIGILVAIIRFKTEFLVIKLFGEKEVANYNIEKFSSFISSINIE